MISSDHSHDRAQRVHVNVIRARLANTYHIHDGGLGGHGLLVLDHASQDVHNDNVADFAYILTNANGLVGVHCCVPEVDAVWVDAQGRELKEHDNKNGFGKGTTNTTRYEPRYTTRQIFHKEANEANK